MSLREVLEALKEVSEFDECLESIAYDGDPESFILKFVYESESNEYVEFSINLFSDGSSGFGILNDEFGLVDPKVAQFIVMVCNKWEIYCDDLPF